MFTTPAPFLQGPMGRLGSFSKGPSSCQGASLFLVTVSFPFLPASLGAWGGYHLLWNVGYRAVSNGFPTCSAPW